MRKGDEFVVFTEGAGSKVSDIVDAITAAAFPDRQAGDDDQQVLARSFRIPQDYQELRRTASGYLDATGAPTATPPASAAAETTPSKEVLDGPLTAWNLSRIENTLGETDLTPYLRVQTVWELDGQGRWLPLFDEHYTSVGDLHRDKFPKVALQPDDRMFMELCRVLDRRSVPEILRRHRGKPGHRRSLNLSLGAFAGSVFAQYLKEAPEFERKSLVLEINRSDLLHQPRETLKAIKTMREAGFGIALDGVGLDLLTITNLHRVDFDYVKITLSPATLKRLPRDKIILCRCEKEAALTVGQAFHLTKFQGWIIDRLASGAGDGAAPAS